MVLLGGLKDAAVENWGMVVIGSLTLTHNTKFK